MLFFFLRSREGVGLRSLPAVEGRGISPRFSTLSVNAHPSTACKSPHHGKVHHGHSERSKPMLFFSFAPAKESACAVEESLPAFFQSSSTFTQPFISPKTPKAPDAYPRPGLLLVFLVIRYVQENFRHVLPRSCHQRASHAMHFQYVSLYGHSLFFRKLYSRPDSNPNHAS